MTRAEVLEQVRRLLADEELPYLWKSEEMDFYYDMAVKDFCEDTGIFIKSVPMSTVANQYLYTVPGSLINVQGISVDGSDLTKVPFSFVGSMKGQTGTVKYYCLDYVIGKFLLHCTPTQDGNNNITVRGSAIPEDTDIDDAIPTKYSHYLIYGVITMAFDKTESEVVSQLALKYEKKWELKKSRVKKDLDRLRYSHINVTLKHPGLL